MDQTNSKAKVQLTVSNEEPIVSSLIEQEQENIDLLLHEPACHYPELTSDMHEPISEK